MAFRAAVSRQLLAFTRLKQAFHLPLLRNMSSQTSGIAFVFPGQGAQKLGMTKPEFEQIEAVRGLYATANSILGYSLDKIVFEDEQLLQKTEHCQPAMLVAGLAAIEKLKAETPEVLKQCSAAAGLSLGEYTALVFAGSLTFEDALKIVQIRAKGMQTAAEKSDGGMLTVLGDAPLEEACSSINAQPGKTLSVANYLAPGIRVASGSKSAISALESDMKALTSVRTIRLPVSGAFHSALMEPACQGLRDALSNVEVKMPRIPVYSNTLGRAYESVEEIREQLVLQVSHPVRFDENITNMLNDGHTTLYELGPQRQIATMVRKINMKDRKLQKMHNVTV